MKSDKAVTFEGLDQDEENCGDDCDIRQGGKEIVFVPEHENDRRARRFRPRNAGGRRVTCCIGFLASRHPGSAAAAGTKDNVVGHFGVTLWTGNGHEFSGEAACVVLLAAIFADSVNLKGMAGGRVAVFFSDLLFEIVDFG